MLKVNDQEMSSHMNSSVAWIWPSFGNLARKPVFLKSTMRK